MTKILHVQSVNDYARYIGAQELHQLVSVIHYDELTQMRHSLNRYEVYGMFLNDGILPELTYGTIQYTMPQHTLMCVSPGQIGGRTDTGEIVHASGWALLFDPKILHDTFLGSQMSRYHFFSYDTSEPLLMTDEERLTIVNCFVQLREELSSKQYIHQEQIIASFLSLILEYCGRFYSRQFKSQGAGENGLLHRLEQVLTTYYTQQLHQTQGLPTVRYCASQLCLSTGYFGDLIKEATGETATVYIHRYVMARANELLRSGKNISQTAFDLGFQTTAHFSRLYKQINGFSPSALKENVAFPRFEQIIP